MQDKSRYMLETDDTIYDSKTSLTWAAKDSRLSLERDISWDEAQNFANKKNKDRLGGHSDWRMPTVQEALTIYEQEKFNKDFKGGDLHIDPIFPPGSGNCTWTASDRGQEAQIIFYLNGCTYWYEKNDKSISHAVRLVRRKL